MYVGAGGRKTCRRITGGPMVDIRGWKLRRMRGFSTKQVDRGHAVLGERTSLLPIRHDKDCPRIGIDVHRRTIIDSSTREGIAAHITVAKLYGSGMVRQVRQVRLLPTSSGTRLGRFSMSRRRRRGSRVRRETSVDTPPIRRPHSTRVLAMFSFHSPHR